MFEFIASIGIGGLFIFGLAVLYIAYVGIMYAIYRLTNGKMKFKEYIKHW